MENISIEEEHVDNGSSTNSVSENIKNSFFNFKAKIKRIITCRGCNLKNIPVVCCTSLSDGMNKLDRMSRTKIPLLSRMSKWLDNYSKKYRKKSGLDPEMTNESSSSKNGGDNCNEISKTETYELPFYDREEICKEKYVKIALGLILLIGFFWLTYNIYYFLIYKPMNVNLGRGMIENLDEIERKNERYDLGWIDASEHENIFGSYIDWIYNKTEISYPPKGNIYDGEELKNPWWWYHAHIDENMYNNIEDIKKVVEKSCRPLSDKEINNFVLDDEEFGNIPIGNGNERKSSSDLALLYDMLCYQAKKDSMTSNKKSRISIVMPKLLKVNNFSLSLNNPKDVFNFMNETKPDNEWWTKYEPPNVCVMAVYANDLESTSEIGLYDTSANNNPNIKRISYKLGIESKGIKKEMIIENDMKMPGGAFVHASKEEGLSIEPKTKLESKFREMIGSSRYSKSEISPGKCSVWINPRINVDRSKKTNIPEKENHFKVMHKIKNLGTDAKFLTEIERNIVIEYVPMPLPLYYDHSSIGRSDNAIRWEPKDQEQLIKSQIYLSMMRGALNLEKSKEMAEKIQGQ